MDKASDFGSEDSRFESWRGRTFYNGSFVLFETTHNLFKIKKNCALIILE